MNTSLRFYYIMLITLFWSVGAFSQCVVTNTSSNIATAGSLKWAIAGCTAGGTITFNIGGAGPHIIPVIAGPWPNGPLGIDKQLHIQGPNSNGAEIIIDGQGTADAFSVGWWDAAPAPGAAGTIIEGLTIVNSVVGISVGPVRTDNITIQNMKIGIKNDGTVVSNSSHGIIVNGNPTNPLYAAFIGAPVNNLKILNSVISGNLQNGIQLGFVSNSDVSGNKIGTNAAGTACAVTVGTNVINPPGGGNGYDGILFDQTTNSTVRNNVISCNGYATDPNDNTLINGTPAKYLGKRGVYFQNSDNNIISGNMIGTNLAGEVKLPNYKSGILISSGSDNNIIGGLTAATRNIISGNGIAGGVYAAVPDKHGIVIDNGGLGATSAVGASTKNKIIGNYIGLSKSGLPLGNAKNGVEIIGNGANNLIGGLSPDSSNIISANGENGISIGQGASLNKIVGNLIGTKTDGTAGGATYGNGNVGVQLNTGNTAISTKDLTSNAIINNIIGQSKVGIQTIGDAKVNSFIVKGNLIGQDINGASIPNSTNGILVQTELTGFQLGGVLATESNVIVNSTQSGINIAPPVLSTGGAVNTIYNNYIGVRKDGVVAKNGLSGIETNDKVYNITIGGIAVNQANIIAGNDGNGIFVAGGDKITIDKNFIGLLADGITPKGNLKNGIQIESTTNAIVQNAQIAFNGTAGISGDGILIKQSLTGSTPTFTIENNIIGTINAMTTNQANRGFGINIASGTGTISNNKVAYNSLGGINISGTSGLLTVNLNSVGTATAKSPAVGISVTGGTNNVFTSNFVRNHATNGVTLGGISTVNLLSGNTVRDNTVHGIAINGGTNTFDNSVATNLITANTQNGVFINGGTNTIGGATITSNTLDGVFVDGGAAAAVSANIITGSTITGNTKNGVVLSGAKGKTTVGNVTLGNTISSNGADGVNISAGATGNTVDKNLIELNGTALTPNIGSGVTVDGANANNIGVIAANTINSNTVHGVILLNSSANNRVENNLIGKKVGQLLGNGVQGISVYQAGTANSLVSNIITESVNNGIDVFSTAGTIITSNILGTALKGNSGAGLHLNSSTTTTVTSNTMQANALDGIQVNASSTNTFVSNTIGSNVGNGVYISGVSNANTFESNNIGVTATGANMSNGTNKAGIQVNGGTGNIIGTTGKPNVFGGTTQDYGVLVDGGTGTKIDFNYFGTKTATSANVSTALNGILVSGTAAVATINENVFSYPLKDAVKLTGTSKATTINSNFFGVDKDGLTNLAAGKPKTAIVAQGAVTSTAITNNIIPSTTGDAIVLDGVATGNSVTGNKIGVLTSNAAGLGNATGDGIVVKNSTSALTISANIIGLYNNGIHLTTGTTNKTISGNFIGTNAAASTNNLGNISNGILIDGTSSNNTINGTNIIAFNKVEGIQINATSVGNLISQNSMYCNASASGSYAAPGNGIGLASGGNTNSATKDFMSVDFSSFRPFVMDNGGSYSLEVKDTAFVTLGITEKLNSGSHKVEVFSVDDNCTNCQGESYLGDMVITGNNASFSSASISPSGKYVVTITRLPSKNSSQFSACSKAPSCIIPDVVKLISNKGIVLDSTVSCVSGAPINLSSSILKGGLPATTTDYLYTWTVDKVEDGTTTDAHAAISAVQRKNYKIRVYSKTDNPLLPNKFKNVAGCFIDDSVNVYIYANPTFTITQDKALCLGDKAPLTVSLVTGKLPYTFTYSENATGNIVGSSAIKDTTWSVKPTGTTAYKLTKLQDKNACFALDLTPTATITVNPLPVITVTAPAPTCVTGINLSTTHNTVAGATYVYKTFDYTAVAPTTVTDSGTYQIIATITATSCKDTASVLASIHKNPTITKAPISAVCAPLTLDLATGITASTGTLSYHSTQANATAGTAALASSIVSEGAIPSVVYFVRSQKVYAEIAPTPATTCFDTDDLTATINPKPVFVSAVIPAVCKPTTVNLNNGIDPTSTSGVTNTFFKEVFTAPVSTPTAVADSGKYMVIGVISATGCKDTMDIAVTINSLPVVSASSNSPVCVGDAINLTSTSNVASTFAWSGPSSYSDATQNPTIAAATLAMDGVYTVEATNTATTCKKTATTTVLVKAKPTPSITNVTNECFNTIAANRVMSTPLVVGNSYKWILTAGTGNAAIDGLDTKNGIDLIYLGYGTVNVQVTETVGTCSEVANAVLTIQDTARYTLSLPADCEYVTNYDLASHTPTPINVAGSTYSAGTGQFLRAGSSLSSPLDLSTLPTGNNQIEYRYTLGASEKACVSKLFTTLKVNPKPTGLAFTPTTPLCATASPITLSGTSTTAGVTKTYSFNGNPVTQFTPTGNVGSNTVYFKAKTTEGCVDSISAPIVVSQPGTPLLGMKQSAVLCQGEQVSFTVSDFNNVVKPVDVYEWRLNNPASPSVHTGTSYTPSSINDGDILYVKLVPNSSSCTNPATKNLPVSTIKKPDITDVIIDPLKVCLNDFFTLGASASNLETINNFEWFKVDLNSQDTTTLSDGQNITDKGDKLGAFKYFVKVTNYKGGGSCTDTDPTNIVQVVGASVTALAGPTKDNLLPQGSRQVQGRPIILYATHPQDGQQYENYQWTLVSVDEQASNLEVGTKKESSHIPSVQEGQKNLVYKVSANVVGLATCDASDTVSVKLIGNCFVPNAFSPNADGQNDTWKITCLTDGDYPNADVKIYNRWGELIYNDERGGTIPWDGTRNGNLVPIGTYYFVIDLNFEDIEQIAGAVAILR